MPPHCDSLDGPVVTAARQALVDGNVDLVLPFVHAAGEQEVRAAFDLTMEARADGGVAREVADQWFFETVVRVHRAGEGAAFTGLKPAGLDVGPVIPAAERSLAAESPEELIEVLCDSLRHEVEGRFRHAMELRAHADEGVEAARTYVDAMLGLEVWAHGVHRQITSAPHAHVGAHDHG